MKLLFIMETMRARGAERVASILTEELASMSHDVYLICTGFVRGEEYSLTDKIHLEVIPEATGSRLHLFFVRIRYIRKKINEIQPDCIISLAAARTLFMITVGHIGSWVPMIFSERHDPVHNPKPKLERLLRLLCYRTCDRVVFQTQGAMNFFPKSIAKKGIIISNPVKEGLPDVWTGPRKPVIVTFCKLVPQKNLSLLLNAFASIADEFPEHRLVIYGDGELRESLETEAVRLHISSRTDFLPHAQNVHELINDCAMFVSSSDYEGQSNSMLEAMAMGLPCVCTDCPSGGASAVIKHGTNGLLVPVGNAEKLAQAMRYMLTHPDDARQMGQNASLIREQRHPSQIAEEWNRLIAELVTKKH